MTSYGIVGAGRVGSTVAMGLARGGHHVIVVDKFADKAYGLADTQPTITAVDRVSEVGDCEVVLEAIPDELDSKISVLSRLANSSAVAVLTATSSFTVAQLARASGLGERLAGFHFLPTSAGSGLIEISGATSTGNKAIDAAVTLSDALGIPWMRVSDVPGRVTRRLLVPFINQVLDAAARGVASPQDIDRVVNLGLGHPVGPLVALKRAGLDDHIQVADNLYRQFGDPAFEVPTRLTDHEETIQAISDMTEERIK
ncbi:3-hydroxyacyl-CoA dehydrogenase family protein [Nocardia sp. CA-107356]|uniref:3-hydroxyacyl-CoA dehydrogenase family protein n=1 Tax=Nocardia sp. CA-107356 TaxID=3239972 RepID=UPI003D8B5DD5